MVTKNIRDAHGDDFVIVFAAMDVNTETSRLFMKAPFRRRQALSGVPPEVQTDFHQPVCLRGSGYRLEPTPHLP